MRVLIVVPRQARMTSYSLPLGLGHISTGLKQAGHQVVLVNPNHSFAEIPVLLAETLHNFAPDIVATGGMSFQINEIRKITLAARELLPNALIIIGGQLVSNQPSVSMRAIPEADIGVVGEGERTIVELLSALSSGNKLDPVKGLIYRDSETMTLRQTELRPIEPDLDSLPEVDYEGLGLDIYAGLHPPGELTPGLIIEPGTRVMPIMTSRGCPYPCTFCCHEATGRRYRVRSLDKVFAELTMAVERFGINALYIYDDLFCLKRSRLEEFCKRIRPYGFRWACSLRVEQITPEVLQMMKESGCVTIGMGVESMSPTILANMRKGTTRDQLEKALSQIYDAGILVGANLIFGDPAETLDTARESLEWMASNSRYDLRTSLIGYHPGSRIYDEALEKGLIKDPLLFLSGTPEINGTILSDEDFTRLKMRVMTYTALFGFAGRLLGMEKTDGFWTIRSVCPHCSTENCHVGVPIHIGIYNRISCKYCNRLYRYPIVFRKSLSNEMRELFEVACRSAVTVERADEIMEVCNKINLISNRYEQVWRMLVQLADVMGNPLQAVAWLEMAAVANPYSPQLFEEMDLRLARLGAFTVRDKFARKAAQLRSQGISSSTYIEHA